VRRTPQGQGNRDTARGNGVTVAKAAATAAPVQADRAQLGGDLGGQLRRRCGEQFGQQHQPGPALIRIGFSVR
jgi:hypothetical protein